MEIKHITIHNFREYQHIELELNSNINILDDSSKNVTILDALSMLIAAFFSRTNISTGCRQKITAENYKIQTDEHAVWLEAKAVLDDQIFKWKRYGNKSRKNTKEIAIAGEEILRRAIYEDNTEINLPVFAYYGRYRQWNLSKKIETEKPKSQLAAYDQCLNPTASISSFEKWFKKIHFSELQKKQRIPAITAVKKAICCVTSALNFFYDIQEDQIVLELEQNGIIPMRCLSSSLLDITCIVADLAWRASYLNPHFGETSTEQARGILLVDRIDLCLQPDVKYRVITNLQKVFPNLQMFLTIDNPLSVLDANLASKLIHAI